MSIALTTLLHPIGSFSLHGFLVLLLIFPKLIENWLKLCDFLCIHITISYCLTISHKCLHSKYNFNRIILYYLLCNVGRLKYKYVAQENFFKRYLPLGGFFSEISSWLSLLKGQKSQLWNFIKFSRNLFELFVLQNLNFRSNLSFLVIAFTYLISKPLIPHSPHFITP